MRHRLASAALLAAAALPAQHVVAPRSPAHGAIVAGKDGLVLPAGEFTVAELIEATASFLCRNYVYEQDAVARRGGFVLQRPLAVDAPGSEELLGALLAARGLAALPLDEHRGIWQVIALDGDPAVLALLPWRTPDEILRRPRLREPVVTALAVRHLDARVLAQTFRQHARQAATPQPPWCTAFAADERLLLLSGYRDQLAPVLQLVHQLELAAAPTSATDAPTLAQRVDRLEAEVADLRAQLAVRHAGTAR
jgi:hypothetical protein